MMILIDTEKKVMKCYAQASDLQKRKLNSLIKIKSEEEKFDLSEFNIDKI